MSDPKAPEGLLYIPCIYDDGRPEQCGAMVEDTEDARRTHRAWHAQEKLVHTAIRTAIGERASSREVRAAIADLRREFEAALADMRGDVSRIEIPTPILPVKRSESGWSDDDEPDAADLDTTDLDAYAGEPTESAADLDGTIGVYADENVANTVALDPADLPTTIRPTASAHDLT